MEYKVPEKLTSKNLRIGARVVWQYLLRHRKASTTLLILSILSALASGFMPFALGRFFDSIGKPAMIWTLTLWAIIQLASYLLTWKINILKDRVSNAMWGDYISRSAGFLLTLPMSFHKQNKSGEVWEKISRASHQLEQMMNNVIVAVVPQLLSIAVALIIGFYINPILALFLVFGTLIYLVTILTSIKPLSLIQKQYWDLSTKMWGAIYDAVMNVLPVKQAVTEQSEYKDFVGHFDKALPLWYRMTQIWQNLTLYQRIAIMLTQTAILAVSAMYISRGSMTIGELIAFFSYATLTFEPLATIAQNWQSIHNGIINIADAEEVLQLPPENYHPKGSRPFSIRGDVRFSGVDFEYNESKSILHDISFEAKAGDVIALVGESGVGKSTLIDLLCAYHFPSKGSVFIDDIDTKGIDLVSLRRQIAVVPQEVVLFNDTIKKNIIYGYPDASEEQITEAARQAHALDFIEKFPERWEQLVGERGVKLSVGQKQRVAIARAILRNPRILILDEPTSALDAGSEKIVTESIERLMEGKTTFIIAHRLSTVRKADKIIVLKEGRIIESGSHAELLKIKGGEYRRLYELQIGLHD